MINKKRGKRRIIVVVVSLVLVVGIFFLVNPIRAVIALSSMNTIETQRVTADVYAVDNQFVNFYLVEAGDGYIAFDAGIDSDVTEEALKELGIEPAAVTAVFLTHTDSDHVGSLSLFPSADIYMAQSNLVFLGEKEGAGRSGSFVNMNRTTKTMDDKSTVLIAGTAVQCIFTPGHTNGSACYVVNDTYLFTGDNLSLKDGLVVLFYAVFNDNADEQDLSIRKLTMLDSFLDITHLFTMHTGYTAEVSTAFMHWS